MRPLIRVEKRWSEGPSAFSLGKETDQEYPISPNEVDGLRLDGGRDRDGDFRRASSIGDGSELGLILGLGRWRELASASFSNKDFVGSVDSFKEEPLGTSNAMRRGSFSFGF